MPGKSLHLLNGPLRTKALYSEHHTHVVQLHLSVPIQDHFDACRGHTARQDFLMANSEDVYFF